MKATEEGAWARRMIDLAVRGIETRIDKLDLEAVIETTLGDSSTSWPAFLRLDPGPLKLREPLWMAEATGREA